MRGSRELCPAYYLFNSEPPLATLRTRRETADRPRYSYTLYDISSRQRAPDIGIMPPEPNPNKRCQLRPHTPRRCSQNAPRYDATTQSIRPLDSRSLAHPSVLTRTSSTSCGCGCFLSTSALCSPPTRRRRRTVRMTATLRQTNMATFSSVDGRFWNHEMSVSCRRPQRSSASALNPPAQPPKARRTKFFRSITSVMASLTQSSNNAAA